MAMNMRNLVVVDDDPKVLDAFRRLFGEKFNITCLDEAQSARKHLKQKPQAAVIVSCMNLPGHTGIEFLKASQSYAPGASRILLTADQSFEMLKKAINLAGVFMILSKPCATADLVSGIEAAAAQFERTMHDRGMLERTLAGSVKMLIDMLSLFHSEAFRRTGLMRPQAMKLAKKLDFKRTWELEMAVMFSPLGEALLPKEILFRYRAAKSLTEQQRLILASSPAQTRDLLKNIPQLEKVAEALYLSGRGFDGSGFPEDGPVGADIPMTARILKLLTDLWYASPEGGVDAAAFEALKINAKQYDPQLLAIAHECLLEDETEEIKREHVMECFIRALKPGDVLVEDVLTEGSHELVLSRGHELTRTTIRRLDQYNYVSGIRQPIRVFRVKKPEPALEPLSA